MIYFYSVLLVGEFETIIAIVLMVLSTIVIISLFMTFFLIYEPNLIIKESSPFKALKNSMQNVFKYGFWKVFGILLLMVLSLFIFNAFVAVLTYGFGLLITIPLSMHFSNVLRMVLCYDSLGMDYYLDNKNVCVTKKRYEKNTMEEMKDLM